MATEMTSLYVTEKFPVLDGWVGKKVFIGGIDQSKVGVVLIVAVADFYIYYGDICQRKNHKRCRHF